MDDAWVTLSPAALLDEARHKEFLQECALELAASFGAPVIPSPATESGAVSWKDLQEAGRMIGQELRALRQRVAELEAQGSLKFVGAWKPGGDYHPGNVSYAGALFICKQHTGARPNHHPECWQLAVKSGRAK